MTNPKNLLVSFGIDLPGLWNGSQYVVELQSSNQWGQVEGKLDHQVSQGVLDRLDQQCVIDVDGALTVYQYPDQSIELSLQADFDQDNYRLVLEDADE